jgi:hypothetical protein
MIAENRLKHVVHIDMQLLRLSRERRIVYYLSF